jgi:Ni/Co efflux regulator RcnB
MRIHRHRAGNSSNFSQEGYTMQKTYQKPPLLLAMVLAGMLASGSAHADKPDWVSGGGKEGKGQHKEKSAKKYEGNREGRRGDHGRTDDYNDRNDRRGHSEIRINAYFNDHQREIANTYYGEQFRRGNCPPGLAKKHNGCLPPGQAKKWRRGYILPRDVIYYDVPDSVVIQLGYPPAGHRYVRVAADILLIAVGTGMVVDAIEDIGR